jgi:hypothetical protein
VHTRTARSDVSMANRCSRRRSDQIRYDTHLGISRLTAVTLPAAQASGSDHLIKPPVRAAAVGDRCDRTKGAAPGGRGSSRGSGSKRTGFPDRRVGGRRRRSDRRPVPRRPSFAALWHAAEVRTPHAFHDPIHRRTPSTAPTNAMPAPRTSPPCAASALRANCGTGPAPHNVTVTSGTSRLGMHQLV